MEKTLVILGGNQLHRGFQNKKKDYKVEKNIVIDWNAEPAYKGDFHIQCDIKDVEKIYASNIDWSDVLCVYTSADIAVSTQIELHKRMGLLAPTVEAINNAAFKGNSTLCWKKAGILNKQSEVVCNYKEFEIGDAKKYIFKPNCSSGSRNITILSKEQMKTNDVKEAFELAASASLDQKVIVEEFCQGIEFTIEMLGDNWGNVSVYGISKKYHTQYNIKNKIAIKLHYIPADVSDDILEELALFGKACYKALGLKNSFGHLEVIYCDDGRIVPVEIGARSSGYIASHLIDAISNDIFIRRYADVLRGGKVADDILYDRTKSAMYFFYDIKPGIGKVTTNMGEFLPKTIISLANERSRLKKGEVFQKLNADHERCGLEILCGLRCDMRIENILAVEEKFETTFLGEK